MPTVVVTAPEQIVSLADAKAYLRVSGSGDDTVISGMLASAQATLDGPDGWLRRALGKQTLETSPCCRSAAGVIALPYAPVLSIGTVTDSIGATVDPAGYAIGSDKASLQLVGSTRWQRYFSSIRYTAGYEKVDGKWPGPPAVISAILLMVSALYNLRNRDPSLTVDTAVGIGSQQFSPDGSAVLTDAAKELVEPLRLRSI